MPYDLSDKFLWDAGRDLAHRGYTAALVERVGQLLEQLHADTGESRNKGDIDSRPTRVAAMLALAWVEEPLSFLGEEHSDEGERNQNAAFAALDLIDDYADPDDKAPQRPSVRRAYAGWDRRQDELLDYDREPGGPGSGPLGRLLAHRYVTGFGTPDADKEAGKLVAGTYAKRLSMGSLDAAVVERGWALLEAYFYDLYAKHGGRAGDRVRLLNAYPRWAYLPTPEPDVDDDDSDLYDEILAWFDMLADTLHARGLPWTRLAAARADFRDTFRRAQDVSPSVNQHRLIVVALPDPDGPTSLMDGSEPAGRSEQLAAAIARLPLTPTSFHLGGWTGYRLMLARMVGEDAASVMLGETVGFVERAIEVSTPAQTQASGQLAVDLIRWLAGLSPVDAVVELAVRWQQLTDAQSARCAAFVDEGIFQAARFGATLGEAPQ